MVRPTSEEMREWTPRERALLSRELAAIAESTTQSPPPEQLRRAVLLVTLGGAALMLPWVLLLFSMLPNTQSGGGAWRLAWVGFDAVLASALAVTGWLVWQRRQSARVGLVVSTTLVLTDAWFDVCLSWGGSEQTTALMSAILVELPVAALLAWAALAGFRDLAWQTSGVLVRTHSPLVEAASDGADVREPPTEPRT